MKLIAIHQPNFLPWLGYFHKIRHADAFIFLDHVQFPKTGGSWINRVKLIIGKEPRWVTIPVDRSFHGTRTVKEIKMAPSRIWRSKILSSIQQSYAKASHLEETISLVEEILAYEGDNLAEMNTRGIRMLCAHLGMDMPQILLSSTINVTVTSNEMLIDLVRHLNGTHYLCGGGASGYQQDAIFESAGIGVVYQNFRHPEYVQHDGQPFQNGLSVLDSLFFQGRSATFNQLSQRPPICGL
jgi:hypothetical protein